MKNMALLIIDMQKISFTPATPRFDVEGVIKRINSLHNAFRGIGAPVIIIQHDGTKEGGCMPGTEDWELLSELETSPSDRRISKTANDCFYGSDLQRTLNELGIEELVITGCATDFCVEATVQSALVKEYRITIVKDGHTTADRPHLKAEQVIEHYNWTWVNMVPVNGVIQVINTTPLLEKLQFVQSPN